MSVAVEEIIRSRPIFTSIPLARILAGQRHAPVVYFAHMGFIQRSEVVKIGTSRNLKSRMDSFYVPLGSVLAVVPGDREVEDAYHKLFAEYQVNHKMREMFRLEGRLRRFLSNQAEGTVDLPPCVPLLVQPAVCETPAAETLEPATDPDTPMSLLEIVRAFLLPSGTPEEQKNLAQALRQDRYRSDKGQLPDGLVFPEPVGVNAGFNGQAELFVPSQVIEFNTARRGGTAA